jgi:hypothetical protein
LKPLLRQQLSSFSLASVPANCNYAVFERIANKIHSNEEINPHAYEEELEERNK